MSFKILITRPREEAEKTSEVFKRYGFQPLSLPMIEFRALEFKLPKPLEEFDYIYFGSKRAAKFFLGKIDFKEKLPKVIAVGEKTALFLREKFNIETDIVLNGYSEQLIELAEKGIISPGKLLAPLPKVSTGNLEKLRRKKFEVYTLQVYETLPIKYDHRIVENMVKNSDIVFFASPSAVRALIENLQNKTEILLSRIIVAIGNTTEKALKEANLKVYFKPSRPSVEVLAKELAEALNGFTERKNS